eukprot:3666335-Amphidinium_carterae.1
MGGGDAIARLFEWLFSTVRAHRIQYVLYAYSFQHLTVTGHVREWYFNNNDNDNDSYSRPCH